jgi:hypothetical protein
MKDLLKKMSQLEASAPKAAPKKKILKESAPAAKVESKNMSLKDMFKQLDEALAPGQKPLPVISKVGSNQTTGAGFLNIDDNSPAGQALQQALGNLAGQNKAEIVVPTQPNQSGQSTQPNQSPNQGGGTIQTSASQSQQAQDAEDQIAERDEGKPGKNFAKIAKKAGKEYGSKAAGERVAGAIRAKLAKQGKLEEEQLDEKWGGDTELNPSKKGMFKGKTKAELEKQLAALHKSGPHKKGSPEYTKQQELNFAIRAKGGWKKGVKEADIPSAAGIDTYGAALGAGRSPTTLEGKKAKPDFLDLDKDGDKKESMKKAASDKKKKAVKENMSNRIRAARFEGKSHGLKGHSYAGKNYEDMEECRAYHDGYKEGLDECYGMATPHMPATTHGMADQSIRDPYTGTLDEMYDEMDEGNAFTAALARTPKGSKFKLGGKSFTDTSSYDSTLDENDYAFESWNRELETLINEGKKINESKKSSKKSLTEGMTISISKGQQGAPDSVNINATDSEADQVISLIKQAGLGIFGGEGGHEELSGEPRGFSIQAPSSEVNTPGDIEIVDDNEGMLGLMKKLSGIQHDGDDAGESDEVSCENCGMPESDCECEEGKLDEVESEDQMTYEVAEDDDQEEPGQNPAMPQNPSDNGSANSTNATKGNNAANNAAAEYDASQKEENGAQQVDEEDEECEDCHSKPCECDDDEEEGPDHNKNWYDTSDELKEEGLNEWANNSRRNNDENWEADIEFMTKVISGGLNKPKSTGQTTDPVIAGQNDRMHSPLNTKDINESASDWAKLAGIRK